jgi:mycothiol system anti-sigma-R factor
MNHCDEVAVKTLRYLDNELEGQELEDFLSHVSSCASCREQLEAERKLSATLERSRPLYSAPTALRSRIAAAMAQEPLSSSAPHAEPPPRRFTQNLVVLIQRFLDLRVLVPTMIALAFCLAFVPDIVRNVRAASYVEAAVAEHRSYLDGSLPLGLRSSSPELVTAWFAHKVPFEFRLPTSEASQGIPAYRLIGAALVRYKGNPAALVTYETQKEKISLLAVSSASAVVAGGDSVRSGKLTFHYHNEAQFRVITWSNHGLSYALVSSVLGSARASCMVCHQNMPDRSDFQVNQ